MRITFILAKATKDFQRIENLARTIFPEHYSPYAQKEHILFFVEKFQTCAAIRDQIKNGSKYFIMRFSGQDVGYLGVDFLSERTLLLSKLYVLSPYRGKGFGKDAIKFMEELMVKRNIKKVELVVNRKNKGSIRFYEKRGFQKDRPVVHRFENGYTNEDYKMVKEVG